MRLFVVMGVCGEVARGLQAAPARGRALPSNVEGNFFVDETCIDCDTCRWMVPSVFSRGEGQSYVAQQPTTGAEKAATQAAAVACPTGSIRSREKGGSGGREAFPARLDERAPSVYHLGYHSPKSFGATPYLVGNVMVDSPRYNSRLAKAIEAIAGPPEFMLLTHIDDVADHALWKQRFPEMKRVMHRADARGPEQWPYIDTRDVEWLVDDTTRLAPGLLAVHVPGHSRGSLAFLADSTRTGGEPVLFTGDHLAFNAKLGRLDGLARYGWRTDLQADSIAKLADLDFLHILPGHGRRLSFDDAAHRRAAVLAAAADFKRDPLGRSLAA